MPKLEAKPRSRSITPGVAPRPAPVATPVQEPALAKEGPAKAPAVKESVDSEKVKKLQEELTKYKSILDFLKNLELPDTDPKVKETKDKIKELEKQLENAKGEKSSSLPQIGASFSERLVSLWNSLPSLGLVRSAEASGMNHNISTAKLGDFPAQAKEFIEALRFAEAVDLTKDGRIALSVTKDGKVQVQWDIKFKAAQSGKTLEGKEALIAAWKQKYNAEQIAQFIKFIELYESFASEEQAKEQLKATIINIRGRSCAIQKSRQRIQESRRSQ